MCSSEQRRDRLCTSYRKDSYSSDRQRGFFRCCFIHKLLWFFSQSVRNILFPREAKQNLKQGKEMEKRSRRNTQWQQEAYVLLPNGTLIWLVTFFCRSIVYCRQSVCQENSSLTIPTTDFAYIVISCTRCCFVGFIILCLCHTYTFYSHILPVCFMSVCVCVCVQILVAGCSCLASSFITLSLASRSLKWVDWNKHMN